MEKYNHYSLIKFVLIISTIISTLELEAKKIGAYISTPNASELEYRLGNGIGFWGGNWGDEQLTILKAEAGYNGQRKKLPEQHLMNWGYGIELKSCEINKKYGIVDLVGYLATPHKIHSSNISDNPEACYPDNLYEKIWLDNGQVNPNNYWAYYINETVTLYKDYVKIWETWNEPDYTRNYSGVSDWAKNPPLPKDLTHWYGSIFQYIRLLRITYEVAKKADPTCWVATGGLGYDNFLDGIMRYTDNPVDGSVTEEFPAYGGAYFDCDAYHQYPQYGGYDSETGEEFNGLGSDSMAKAVIAKKKSHDYVIRKYGFGKEYPSKIFINTETGVPSKKYENNFGGDIERRNWILKLGMYALEYDVKQIHILNIVDNDGYGDYTDIGQYTSEESLKDAIKKMKSSTKGRITLKKINLGKFIFDKEKTKEFREKLLANNANMTGIVLKRKFPKEENETHYANYIYSIWIYCDEVEFTGSVNYKLNFSSSPLFIDWEQNEKVISKNENIKVSSTPLFLLLNNTDNIDNDSDDNGDDDGDNEKNNSDDDGKDEDDDDDGGISTFILSMIGLSIILVIAIVIGGFYLYTKLKKSKDNSSDENDITPLMKESKE